MNVLPQHRLVCALLVLLVHAAAAAAVSACARGDVTWETPATDDGGTHTCGARIIWLQSDDGGSYSESDAREIVASELPDKCGSCFGGVDNDGGATNGDSQDCSDVWDVPTTDKGGTHTCGQRIEWLQTAEGGLKREQEAKYHVGTEFPDLCGPCASDTDTTTTCEEVWDVMATDDSGTHTCGERIGWLQTAEGGSKTEDKAKNFVASEFPELCGACATSTSTTTTPSDGSDTLSVVTQNLFWWNLFNIRGGENFFSVFKSYGPYDIFLFQECENVDHIRNGLGYTASQMSTIQDRFALAIMYNSSRFVELNRGFEVVGEDRYDRYYGERGMAWARLHDHETGKTFFVVTHHGPLPTDTGGKFGPEDVANRIVLSIDSHKEPDDQVILAGDFNSRAQSKTLEYLEDDGYKLQGSDDVDHILSHGDSLDNNNYKSTIIYGTGSDHQGVKTVWSF